MMLATNHGTGSRAAALLAAGAWLLMIATLFSLGRPGLAAEIPWQVPEAELRFEMEITELPSEPCAGVIAILPDGGILPRAVPVAVVLDPAGKELRNQCVWYNPREGLGLVFEPPASAKSAFIYLRPGARLNVLMPGAPFCPSLLLYTAMGRASLDAAKQLATEYPPGKDARFGLVEAIAHTQNPFGHSDNYLSYYTGWLKTPAAGRTYFATISEQGSECLIDGAVAVTWPGLHTRQDGAKGQHGEWQTLAAGPHRVQYFQFEQNGRRPEAQLGWRPANQPADALVKSVPVEAFVHSGTARIRKTQARQGIAPAIFAVEPISYLWLKDKPVNLFRFNVSYPADYPAGTTFTWDFGDGLKAKGTELFWVFEGSEARDVTLTVAGAAGASKSTRPVYFASTPWAASIDHPANRKQYRQALLERCRSAAPGHRAAEGWSPDLWATLLGVAEPYDGLDLLRELFERSRPDVLALKPEDRRFLENAYFDLLRGPEKERAAQWLDRFEREAADNAQRFHWQLRRVDFLLYDLNDAKRAQAVADSLRDAALAAGPEATARWQVREGDLARLAGNYEEARRCYTAAQDRYRTSKTDWRAEAVRETSYYETTHSLIEQGYLAETQALLAKWEIEFPLSKLAGDYPIAEAEYFIALSDCPRAVRLLEVYRQQVEMSSFLPKAMELELGCLVDLKQTAALQRLVADITKRFPNLELAKKAAAIAQADEGPDPRLQPRPR